MMKQSSTDRWEADNKDLDSEKTDKAAEVEFLANDLQAMDLADGLLDGGGVGEPSLCGGGMPYRADDNLDTKSVASTSVEASANTIRRRQGRENQKARDQKELTELKNRIEGLEQARDGRSDHHATVDRRLEHLEKMVAVLADKHTQWEGMHVEQARLQLQQKEQRAHHASMQERMDHIEKMLGDSAEWGKMHVEQARLQKQQDELQSNHASLQERMGYIEELLGDSMESEDDSFYNREEESMAKAKAGRGDCSSNSSNSSKHSENHVVGELTEMQCSDCDAQFYGHKHFMIKEYKCFDCEYRGEVIDHRGSEDEASEQHVEQHEDIKEFQCFECGIRFYGMSWHAPAGEKCLCMVCEK